jgi:UDP-N-acetylmuramate dehydrogenase
MVGVPGTIGGALPMNAGAYGTEMKDVLIHAHGLDRYGHEQELRAADFDFGYRKSGDKARGLTFTRASFQAHTGDPAATLTRMEEISTERQESQPIGTRTGGSTFKNPDGAKAWELIDRAGCRGMRIGDAQVSEKHCNFLVNHGMATAAQIEELGETVRAEVKAKTGVELEWEIRRIGKRAEAQA